ncbi:uncharacterized protein KY384_007096 [Bacidia gigantensis]|uniref:uncharacterized protein n=1 Tax=Bacidia gigantensis TaxID=2732470 RepID=UPI001D04BA88|nr:uncharacterized protein KY384_007096 [Bacidia gigantensis]KAG8528179.1 hypothetical protein KY384_007096 [Bacidia gigantensis]
MAYQQPGSSSAPFQPTGAQVLPLSQNPGPNQQYATPSGAAMLPPQRPYQPNPNSSNASGTALTSSAVPSGQPPSQSQPSAASAMTVAANSPTSTQVTSNADASGQPNPPTPKIGKLSRENEERVAALLGLNSLLLRELQQLQSVGAALAPVQGSPQQQNASAPQKPLDAAGEAQKSPTGSVTTPTTTTPTPQTPKLTKPPPKLLYDNYLKRIQVNIAYLLALSGNRPLPPHPGAMESPPDSWFQPSPGEVVPDGTDERAKETAKKFKDAYQKLRELWPNYKRPQKPPPQMMGQPPQLPRNHSSSSSNQCLRKSHLLDKNRVTRIGVLRKITRTKVPNR